MAASEDMTVLTILIAQLPAMAQQPQLVEALNESAFDAALLPRHRQELLGSLVRRAAGQGDRARATRYLGWMAPWPAELEADSELRISVAALASLDGDSARALALLGLAKDEIPIADSLDALASVLRAHAFEMAGDAAGAARTLRELPEPGLLRLVRERLPALRLCPQAGETYGTTMAQEAAQRAATAARSLGGIFGGTLILNGVLFAGIGIAVALGDPDSRVFGIGFAALGVISTIAGLVLRARARAKGAHAAWVRMHGTQLTARIASAQPTGISINDVPQYRLALQVAGPAGPYPATVERTVPEHQIALLLGQEVRIRANPTKLEEIMLEE
jgi:hypothetical protein